MSHGLSWRTSLSFVLILSSQHTGLGRPESSFLPQRDCKFIAYYLIQFGEREKSIPPAPALVLSLVDPGNDWGGGEVGEGGLGEEGVLCFFFFFFLTQT